MELLAAGRMAEVFAYGEGRVVKLDRPEWSGVGIFEAEVIERAAAAGLPVARSHGVVTIDGRCGVVLDRVDGHELLADLLEATGDDIGALAERFCTLQADINGTEMDGLPDLVERLGDELARSGLSPDLMDQLTGLLDSLDDGRRGVCHFDFHPLNVLVSAAEWVVIDWLTVASGPPVADLARTLVLWGRNPDPAVIAFLGEVRRRGSARRHADDATVDNWVRVVAGARLAEGFDGEDAAWLRRVAAGEVQLYA
jgi:aminoglycoside phosphotransferase (APT) family kinase protein